MKLNLEGRALVTGGAIGDIPTIQGAKDLGLKIYTSGNRPNDPGHKIVDNYIKADYTNIEDLGKLVNDLKIDYIFPSCHDTAYITAAKVAKICGLPGFDDPKIADMIHQKDQLAIGISEAGLSGIETRIVEDYESATKFFYSSGGALVVKPSDMTGGRGVTFVNDIKNLRSAIEIATESSFSKRVLVQEFVDGSEHGFTSLIKDQKVIFSFFDDEYRFINRYRVAGTSTPSSIDSHAKYQLIRWINRFSKYFQLADGLMHLQFIQIKSGPKVLEVCRRPPGDLYPYFVEDATKYPYIQNFILGFMGLAISSQNSSQSVDEVTFRHVVLADKNGTFKGLSISNHILKNISQRFEFKQNGDIVTSFLTETLAIFILKVPIAEKQDIQLNIQKYLFPIIEVS